MTLNPLDIVQTALDALQLLENVFGRSIAFAVVNNSNYTLTLFESDFSSGGFQKDNLPSPTIPPMSADVFGGTNETDPSKGVVGSLTYTAADAGGNDMGATIILDFDNPLIGSDKFGQVVNPIPVVPDANFSVQVINSLGNNCQVKYVITAS